MQVGSVGTALRFRHLYERYLAGRHNSQPRRRREVRCRARTQIHCHSLAPAPEKIVAEREVCDGHLMPARRQVANDEAIRLAAGDRLPIDDVIRLNREAHDGIAVDHQTRRIRCNARGGGASRKNLAPSRTRRSTASQQAMPPQWIKQEGCASFPSVAMSESK